MFNRMNWRKDSELQCNSFFRFILASRLQSDWMLMLFFAHTHLTVTVTVGLLLIPKVLCSFFVKTRKISLSCRSNSV